MFKKKKEVYLIPDVLSEKVYLQFLARLDEEAYLGTNTDLAEALKNKTIESIDSHFRARGMNEIYKGVRILQKGLTPYNENTYVKFNNEIKKLLSDKIFLSGFEHYLLKGYHEILEEIEASYVPKVLKKRELFHYIDTLVQIDNKTLFISGWYYGDENTPLKEIAIIPEQGTMKFFNHPRGDLKAEAPEQWREAGFYGIIKLDNPLIDMQKFSITFQVDETMISKEWEVDSSLDAKELSTKMLLPIEIRGTFRTLFEEAFGPALDALWQKHYKIYPVTPQETLYGILPENPELSIIIPLYGRIDFMEYQLTIFANDFDFKTKVEVIYVLDDPERFSETIDEVSKSLYNLTNVSFKVITYNTNLGYARANNVGVSFASADKILLLNSDVFPRENGWVTQMLEIYSKLETPGTLGFKLLFEDNSIQHAGMVFERNPYFDNMWANIHPHKGMPDLEDNFVVKEVPAVTGACMLLEKENYLAVGGLSENYVLGDFEDSDLCLKLMEKGFKIYYSTEPSLYHLERQSQSLFDDQSWKFKITVFNCWQQTKQWNETIEKTMEYFNA